MKKVLLIVFIFNIIASPAAAQARFFDPNDIFTDAELFDSNSLSRTAIQQFLDAKNSVLKNVTAAIEGVPKLVSEMIYEVGKKYGVSQKFLLAKLQHEQGLIEKSTTSQNAIDWATGYSCFNNRCNDKYKGIYSQLDAAADIQKIYSERSQSKGYFGYSKGTESTTKDGFRVTPANQATTNLYIYTPYRGGTSGVGGNYAFWRVWNRYFTERIYPDGAALFDEATGQYWKIENNKKRLYSSKEIYLSYTRAEDAIKVDAARLSYYQTGAPLAFANNAIIKAQSAGITYYVSDGMKHRVVGSEGLALLGYRAALAAAEPAIVDDKILDGFGEGEPITGASVYPQGLLVISPGRSIFWLKNGVLYPLYDEAVWIKNFGGQTPQAATDAELAKYPKTDPIKLKDGSIVKNGGGDYFAISAGEKHKISAPEIASRIYGADVIANAPIASAALLDLHPNADAIDYINSAIADPPNYVSYAERVGAGSIATGESYLAAYDTVAVTRSMLAASSQKAVVRFRNRGTAPWLAASAYLKLIDENKNTSSFLANNLVPLTADVSAGNLAEFNFTITAPSQPGKIKEWFILAYKDAAGNLAEMPGGLVAADLNVISGNSAQITKHNITAAVKNTWKPVSVKMEIKNTSTDQIWTSRRTALILRSPEGESPFYDANDWVNKEVAGVPLNKSTIKPGETAVFKFTLAPRRLKKGARNLLFSLELKDLGKQVYLNGAESWERIIRVD